jgi:hypothetical protein
MTATDSNAGGRLRLGGIKLSLELVQINCIDRPGEILRGARLIRRLADSRINILFFFLSSTARGAVSSFGIEADDFNQAQRLLEPEPDLQPYLETIRSVGTLTLFPHQFSLKLLGLVMFEFGRTGLPIYGMGTSISALTISTDYRYLDQAFSALKTVLDLPANHTPFRPEFHIKQI